VGRMWGRCNGAVPGCDRWISGSRRERQGGRRAKEEVVSASIARCPAVKKRGGEGGRNGGYGGSGALRAVARSGRW
jgi:hypothetical protein